MNLSLPEIRRLRENLVRGYDLSDSPGHIWVKHVFFSVWIAAEGKELHMEEREWRLVPYLQGRIYKET